MRLNLKPKRSILARIEEMLNEAHENFREVESIVLTQKEYDLLIETEGIEIEDKHILSIFDYPIIIEDQVTS